MGRFIQIAMGSGAELSYHFLLARDLGFFEAKEYECLDSELGAVMRMMSSLSQKVRSHLVDEEKLGPAMDKLKAKS